MINVGNVRGVCRGGLWLWEGENTESMNTANIILFLLQPRFI